MKEILVKREEFALSLPFSYSKGSSRCSNNSNIKQQQFEDGVASFFALESRLADDDSDSPPDQQQMHSYENCVPLFILFEDFHGDDQADQETVQQQQRPEQPSSPLQQHTFMFCAQDS